MRRRSRSSPRGPRVTSSAELPCSATPTVAARCLGCPLRSPRRAHRRASRSVPDVDETVRDPALIEQFERHADLAWQIGIPATCDDRRDEQVILVDKASANGVRGERRTAHRKVAGHGLQSRTTSASNVRSSRVLAIDTVSSVVEYAYLSAARQSARTPAGGRQKGSTFGVSHTAIVSYILRPRDRCRPASRGVDVGVDLRPAPPDRSGRPHPQRTHRAT